MLYRRQLHLLTSYRTPSPVNKLHGCIRIAFSVASTFLSTIIASLHNYSCSYASLSSLAQSSRFPLRHRTASSRRSLLMRFNSSGHPASDCSSLWEYTDVDSKLERSRGDPIGSMQTASLFIFRRVHHYVRLHT